MSTIERERTWGLKAEVRKWRDEESFDAGEAPYEIVTSLHNLLVNAGIARLEDLLIGAGGQAYDATHARLGVGNDTTAAAASQTDLQAAAGSGNRQWKLVSTAPTRSGQTLTFVAAFQTGEANFVWNEFAIDVGTADGTTVVTPMLNRKVSSLGTKTSGVWTLTVTVTIS